MREDKSVKGIVYVLHFEKKYKHARHYIGFSRRKNFLNRLAFHRAGKGGNGLIQAVVKEGIKILVGNIFFNKDGNYERYLKQQKKSSRYCLICNKEGVK